MINYRNFGLYFINVVFLILIPIFVVPNLSFDLKNYKSKTKILESSRIERREYTKNFSKRVHESLILKMTDSSEVKLTTNKSCWRELQSQQTIGKRIKYYLGIYRESGTNPIQLEVDGKILYDGKENIKWGYILILMTIALTIYHIIEIRKYMNNKIN